MTTPATSPIARRSLRRLTTPHALDFSSRLLDRTVNGVVTFREFVQTAREYVREDPERSATYLAALIALDMSAADDDESQPGPPEPSRN